METVKWKIPYDDRVGLISDISRIVSRLNINIKSFELHETQLYLVLECLTEELEIRLRRELAQVKGVKGIEIIESMPWEEREKQLKAVLDSVSEGIIAVNQKGFITTINPVARRILGIEKKEIKAKPFTDFLTHDSPLLECLKTGRPYNNREMVFTGSGGEQRRFLSSGRPLVDHNGKVIGAVASLKDMVEVHQLVYEVTKPSMTTFAEIIGESSSLKEAIRAAKMVARGDSTVLLRGESGTGKELFARAIHMTSSRAYHPFVPVNCAALPDPLLESELFGYAEGAFTGAQKGGKAGLFELANKGTIFLDEVAEISPHLQAKLLRVLQEGKVRRIGDRHESYVNARIIAATNRNLEMMIEKGDFREDLYYRLNVVPVFIPALRDRKEDIAVLAKFFIKKLGRRLGKKIKNINDKALAKLENHTWPGNVRELRNVIERAIILSNSDIIEEEHILLDRYYDRLTPGRGGDVRERTLSQAVEDVEKELIIKTLNKSGSIRQAAKKLGVSHTTILNKLKKYNIKEW